MLTVGRGETLAAQNSLDGGASILSALHALLHQHHWEGSFLHAPQRQEDRNLRISPGGPALLKCMTWSRTDNHSFNVQAERSKSLMTTASWIHSFLNNKPLWVEPPWQMVSPLPLSHFGIQGTALFSHPQMLSYKPCLSASWTASFPLGKRPLFCTRPFFVQGLLQKVSATEAAGAGCTGVGEEGFLYSSLSLSLYVSLCVLLSLFLSVFLWVSLCNPQPLSASLCLTVKVEVPAWVSPSPCLVFSL